jgi:hypothetical protein
LLGTPRHPASSFRRLAASSGLLVAALLTLIFATPARVRADVPAELRAAAREPANACNEHEREMAREAQVEGEAEAERERERELEAEEGCGKRPEGLREQAQLAGWNRWRLGGDDAASFTRAALDRAASVRSGQASTIAGGGGTWAEYGHGPLIGDDPTYPTTLGDGFGKMGGRVNDFAYNEQTGAVYAGTSAGGVWKSADLGEHWAPIGDGLPVLQVGALAWTPAGGGTLIVATGDHAFSNDYAGVGTFWSTDEGTTWHKADGAPDGALSFRVAVDPTDPSRVYLATGKGLFRSNDVGRSFVNVNLPTGPCAGNSDLPGCFFANIVTDVAVQSADDFGHAGGVVMAAVGWRAGRQPNFAGNPEAPANGLYRSPTGLPGTFTMIPDSAGFTKSEEAGRTEFGTTTGPGQNSNYLYAVSQNSRLFNEQTAGVSDLPLGLGTPSVLDAVFVSTDFGLTWTVMESRNEFIFDPANLSALSQLTALGIGPGYQVTYNEFIKPDPTRHVNGVPTRVILGMEEVWQNAATHLPQSGHSQFIVFGAYTASGGACLVVPEQCGTAQAPAERTTTHPDQHAVLMVPDVNGGVTLLVGNDGGVYKQHAAANGEFTQLAWGDGANTGFNTILPYGVAMAKDGTVYGGLQDNGELKILPNGDQHTVYVGDGIFALVDPDDSDVAYDELPLAGVNVTTDGGTTWTSIDPGLKSPSFVAPLLMDPADANHIFVAGREIAESDKGPATENWAIVFDLGTHEHPGDPSAQPSDTDAPNVAVAAALSGDNIYVGFCGECDPVKLNREFHNGFATNVGGEVPPQRLTGNGWHITAAEGLPNRIITSVAIDPTDPRTVYVTLGSSSLRYFAPLGSQEEDTSDVGSGHLYKSTDAGETFTDISGDLPDVQATSVLVRGEQLIVGTAIGAYISPGNDGGHFEVLGTGLPPVAIYQLAFKPGDDTTLVAATFGRSVWTYHGDWTTPAPAPTPGGGASPGGATAPTGGSTTAAWVAVGLLLVALAGWRLVLASRRRAA